MLQAAAKKANNCTRQHMNTYMYMYCLIHVCLFMNNNNNNIKTHLISCDSSE